MNPISMQMVEMDSSDHGAVFIDMFGTIDVDGVAGQPAPGKNVTMRNQLLGMQSGLLSIRHDNVELRTTVSQIHLQPERCFGILSDKVRQIALQPAS